MGLTKMLCSMACSDCYWHRWYVIVILSKAHFLMILTTKTELYYRLLRRYMKQALACSQQYLKLIFTDILNLYLIFLSWCESKRWNTFRLSAWTGQNNPFDDKCISWKNKGKQKSPKVKFCSMYIWSICLTPTRKWVLYMVDVDWGT